MITMMIAPFCLWYLGGDCRRQKDIILKIQQLFRPMGPQMSWSIKWMWRHLTRLDPIKHIADDTLGERVASRLRSDEYCCQDSKEPLTWRCCPWSILKCKSTWTAEAPRDRLQALQVHGPPTKVGARGRRKPGQLLDEEVELVAIALVGEQAEQRTWGFVSFGWRRGRGRWFWSKDDPKIWRWSFTADIILPSSVGSKQRGQVHVKCLYWRFHSKWRSS